MALFQNGIDVSRYQGNINWGRVAAAGKQFAIVRVGSANSGGLYVDPYFLQNVNGAKAAGLRDSAVLNDGQAGKRLAALVVDALCTLIDQVALVLRDILTVFIRNINMIVLCEVDHVVQLERNADAVIARAHIGARSRNGYTNHCISLLYRIRIAARTSPRPFSFSAAAFISAVDSLRV